MTSISPLSTGCMELIMTGNDFDRPVLQILGSKKISGGEGTDRFRLLVSDGKYLNSFAMLATQLNEVHAQGKLVEFTIVRVDRYTTSMVNKSEQGYKRVLIILELTVLNHGAEVGKKIGSPVSYNADAAATSKPAQDSNKNIPNRPPAGNPISNNGSSYNKPMHSANTSAFNESISSMVTHPIVSLSPYQTKWVIKARVTSKSAKRSWSNAKGEGTLFSMDLMDESGQIRATAFKEQCEKFYDIIDVDKVYFISKCQLKFANKQYTTIDNSYEMTFTNETIVQLCTETDTGIPNVQYDLVPISQIANIEPKANIDVIGICREYGEVQTFTGKANNREFKKRDITLVDTSNASVSLTLWGDEAVNFDGYVQPIILIKGARVSDFGGGKSLTTGAGCTMKINPDIPEGHKLRGWFDNGGGENITNNVSKGTGGAGTSFSSEWLTFLEVQAKNLGSNEKPDYFQNKATISLVKGTNALYKACPQQDCNKKVVDEGNGHYRCEKCNREYPDFKYRLLINMNIADWTHSKWATCFSDVGELILGKPAQEIGQAIDDNPEAADEIFSKIHFNSYIFKMRIKMEVFGDVHRSKITILNASPINYKEYNAHLIKNLKELTGIGKN